MAVTIDDLKLVYSTSLGDDVLTGALNTAQMIVDEDIKPKCSMSSDRYDKITLFLAAHFAYLSETSGNGIDGAIRRSKIGESDESYTTVNSDATGYETSRWGQMAMALDKCGILAGQNANKGLKAELRVV